MASAIVCPATPERRCQAGAGAAGHTVCNVDVGDTMTPVRFGLIMPAESRDQRWRTTYVTDLTRFLDRGTGHFDSAWIVDHLQSGDADLLEGFTTLAYMAALHPRL